MTRGLVVGVDCSTTACKAIAWNVDGQALAEGRASYPLIQPAPNWYEQEAEGWWRGLCGALTHCLDQIDVRQVEALCITHQRESFVPVDQDGRSLRKAILWLDERSHAQVEDLSHMVGPERFHQITGKLLTTNPSVTKILWLAQHEPTLVARAFKFLDVHAYLVHRLTGTFRTSVASADPMGLVDMQARAWADELITELGLRAEQFPELVAPGSIIGCVSEAAALATGLSPGLPVVAGAGDGQCAGLGANAVGGGRAALNLGTAVVSGVMSADYLVGRAFRTLCAPITGHYFLETVIEGGAFTVSWFVERFASDLGGVDHSPEDILEAEASQVPPGALGLMLVPYWNHAMTPYWDPAARGITIGWTGAHDRAHFFRAILEGIAFEQRLLGDGLMAAMAERLRAYVVLGGGSRSDLWCQILADVTGIPVERSTTVEATCLGAGILAATAVAWYPDPLQAAAGMTSAAHQGVAPAERFAPNAEMYGFYDRLYREVYQPLFPTLQRLIHRLGELTSV
jgi:xylulokinase